MKVLLMDDRTLFMEGLQNLLQSYGIEITRMSQDEAGILKKVKRLSPAVVMMNVAGDGREKLKTILNLKTVIPEARIIAFADGEENLQKAAQSGAAGYLLTDIHFGELLRALREIERGATLEKAANTVKIGYRGGN